jgi:hypothetical protein
MNFILQSIKAAIKHNRQLSEIDKIFKPKGKIMTKLHTYVVFQNEGNGLFAVLETGELNSLADCKAWIAANGKPDVTYRTGTILEKDIRVQKVEKQKLIMG